MNRTHRAAVYMAFGAMVTVVGLIVHRYGARLFGSAHDATGDALWATMMGCWVSAIMPQRPPRTRYLVALAICYTVETSQLWHAPILDSLRATQAGRLVLGSGFDARDFIAYFVGILLFALLDTRLVVRRAPMAS